MYRRNYYSNDPRWIVARFDSVCAEPRCKEPIKKGESLYYYPLGKRGYCAECGSEAEHDFRAQTENEDYYGFNVVG